MNTQEAIGIYKLGQKVALYGYIDAINIEDVNDIENTTTIRINTPVKTISVNPKYEAVTTNLNKPKPVVPQYVADFYESIKDDFEDGVCELCAEFYEEESELSTELYWWFKLDVNKPIETLVKMKLFGYEVEKEKLYTAKVKIAAEFSYLNKRVERGDYFMSNKYESFRFKTHFSQSELEDLGLWNNPAFEIEEVEE